AKAKKEGRSLHTYIEKMEQAYDALELRLKINDENASAYANEVLLAFKARAIKRGLSVVVPSYEGVRISFPDGFLLLRNSLHEPVMPLNLEGNCEGASKRILKIAQELLEGFDKIDMTIFND
ncbi:MAG: phosphomannomutase/phosphoglucomutase, partial [Oscillospiraceae bacterium]